MADCWMRQSHLKVHTHTCPGLVSNGCSFALCWCIANALQQRRWHAILMMDCRPKCRGQCYRSTVRSGTSKMAFALQHHGPAGSCRQLAIYQAPQNAAALDQDEPEGPPSVKFAA